jgi:hypothetical protein
MPTLLSPANFTHEASIAVPASVAGLSYRAATDTFFCLDRGGQQPGNLVELSLSSGLSAKIVKAWGPLDQSGQVIYGKLDGASKACLSLVYVADNCLIVNGAEYYISQANNPVLWAFDLTSGAPLRSGGPWSVPAAVGSGAVAGSMQPAPSEIKVLGFDWLANGLNGCYLASYGYGATAFNLPGDATAAGEIPAYCLAKWPGVEHIVSQANQWRYKASDFPRPAIAGPAGMIFGNDDCGAEVAGIAQGGSADTIVLMAGAKFNNTGISPPFVPDSPEGWYVTNGDTGEQQLITAWLEPTSTATVAPWKRAAPKAGSKYLCYRPSYQPTDIIKSFTGFGARDAWGHGATIELLDATGAVATHGMFNVSALAKGFGWYGDQNSHDDDTAMGAKYGNRVPSLIYPGKWCLGDTVNRGQHAEAHGLFWSIVDPAALAFTAKKVLAGTATPLDLQVLPSAWGDYATLCGGALPNLRGNPGAKIGQMSWVPDASGQSGKLYCLSQSGGHNGMSVVEVFQVE